MSWHTGQSTLGNQERKMALRLANAGDFDEISKLFKGMENRSIRLRPHTSSRNGSRNPIE